MIDNFVQQVLQFKGTYDDAQIQVQSFVAQLLCSLLQVNQNQELLVFNACMKRLEQTLLNIHNYFQEVPPPINRIFKPEKHIIENQWGSDSDQKYSRLKPENEYSLPVDEKVKIRDNLIEKMTIGYLKDVQHLREMFVRKELFPHEEIFDVSYYDYTNGLDPIIKQFIYNKILDVTQQFRIQIEKLTHINTRLLQEIDKLRTLVQRIVGSAEIESQIKAILALNSDIYRFWKGIQEVIGIEEFFDIFEKRKHGYGINYPLIDSCISKSQASGRIYQEFKENLEQQQIKLTENVGREIVQLRKQIESLNYQLQDQIDEKQANFIQVKSQIKSSVESIYEIKFNTFREQQKQNIQDAMDLIADNTQQIWIKKCIKQFALKKWREMAKHKKQINLRKRSQSLSKEYISLNIYGLKDTSVEKLKQKLTDTEKQLIETQMNLFEMEGEHTLLKSKYNNVKYNFEMLVQKSVYMSQQIMQLENIVEYFNKIFHFIKSRLGYNYLEINLKNSHYYLERSDKHLKQFEDKIYKLQFEDYDLLSELVQQLAKRQIIYKKLNENNISHVATLTDVYDIQQPLQESDHNINDYIILMNEQLKQTEIDDQQAEYQFIQAEELYREQQQLVQDIEEKQESQGYQSMIQSQHKKNSILISSENNSFQTKKEQKQNQQLQQLELSQRFRTLKTEQCKIKTKNQYQQTNVTIDCTICFNDLSDRMNPTYKNPIEEKQKNNSLFQISKSKLFQVKQNTIGTLLTQQNVLRMQSARGRKIVDKSQQHQTYLHNRPASKYEKTITVLGDRAQIIITPKSVPFGNRKCK